MGRVQGTGGDRDDLARLFDGPDWMAEPGCSVALLDAGEVVWSHDYGLAHLGAGRPITSPTRFRICSITKSLFALTLLALEDEGRLSLDDKLDRLVPESRLPYTPTLAQMLAMKSGVLETYELNWLALGGAARYDRNFAADPALALLLRQQTQNFQPGTRTLYSNSNYVLLQLVAERVTGRPLAELLRTRVFEPAGMSFSTLADGLATRLAGVATPYRRDADRFVVDDPDVETGASGGVVSTVEDMIRLWLWLRSDPRGWRGRLSPEWRFPDGQPSGYAMGFSRQMLAGRLVLGHAGGMGGWLCQTLWSPETDLAVVVLGNRADISWLERAREMLVTWWGAPGDPSATPRLVRPEPPPPTWRATYGCEATIASVTLEGARGELVMQGRRMPVTPDGLYRRSLGEEAVCIEALGGIDVAPAEIVRTTSPLRERMLRSDPSTAPASSDLVGVYRAEDLPEPLQVSQDEQGRLIVAVGVRWPADPPLLLDHVIGRLFRASDAQGRPHDLHLRFERGEGAKAPAVTAAMLRLTGISFERVDETLDTVWRFRPATAKFSSWPSE